MSGARVRRTGLERGSVHPLVRRHVVDGLVAARAGRADRRDRQRATGLELAEQPWRALADQAVRGVELELLARVGDVEVAHGELADAVERAEGGALGPLHAQALRLVGEVRAARAGD